MPRSGRWINRRKDERRAAAEVRQAARAARTDAQQLAKLESAGHGHCAEAKRLRGEGESSAAPQFASKAEQRRYEAQKAGASNA